MTVSIMCVGRVRICLDMYIAHPRIIFLVEHGVSPWRIFFRDMGSFQCLSSGVLCNKTWAMVVKRWKRIWVCSWSTPWSTEIKSSRYTSMYNKASTRFFSGKGVLSDIFIFIWDPGVGDGLQGVVWCGVAVGGGV